MTKKGIAIGTIADIKGLTIEEIKFILEGEDGLKYSIEPDPNTAT